MLRWAAIEAAQQAWRPNNPWHQLYLDVKERCGGKGNPAKAAVARKVLIATWHVLALQQPFTPSRPRGADAPEVARIVVELRWRSSRVDGHTVTGWRVSWWSRFFSATRRV